MLYKYRYFWAAVRKTVRPVLSNRCSVCPVCDVGVLWPNGWMDQDATWYSDRPQPRRHCVRLGPSPPPCKKGAQQPPLFGPSAFVPKCVCHLCIKELLTYLLSVAKRSPISATAELLLRNRWDKLNCCHGQVKPVYCRCRFKPLSPDDG